MSMATVTELEAFGRLVEAHHVAVCAIAFATTRDLALSEDIAQDTFVTAWSERGRLRNASHVRAWLCGIARNKARNALRRRRRESPADDAIATVVDPGPSQVDAAVEREALHEVRVALANVPDAYREPLVLFYWEEQSISQVASVLSITEPAAQKRLSRGRAYLREGLTAQIEQVGRARRPAATVAATVVAILMAQVGSAHAAAMRPAIAKGTALVRPALMLAVGAGVSALLVIALMRPREPACCEPARDSTRVAPSEPSTTPSSDEQFRAVTKRTRELANVIERVAFENRELARRTIALEDRQTAPVIKSAGKRSAAGPSVAASIASAPRAETLASPATELKKLPKCDLIVCALEAWKGACCQAWERILPKRPTQLQGMTAYDLGIPDGYEPYEHP